jgi:hypothetical protein
MEGETRIPLRIEGGFLTRVVGARETKQTLAATKQSPTQLNLAEGWTSTFVVSKKCV